MLRIGLTGGIGSGKTTVAHIFEVLGIPVYYADAASKKIMNENATLKKQLKKAFGEHVYKNELLNRKWLAAEVFKNSEKLALLNSLVHPLTISDAEAWMKKQTTVYAVKEAALIFESGAEQYLDYVIGVSAPENLRIERVMLRESISKEMVITRMNKQMNEEEKMNRCDFLLINSEIQLLVPQVIKLHEKLLALSH